MSKFVFMTFLVASLLCGCKRKTPQSQAQQDAGLEASRAPVFVEHGCVQVDYVYKMNDSSDQDPFVPEFVAKLQRPLKLDYTLGFNNDSLLFTLRQLGGEGHLGIDTKRPAVNLSIPAVGFEKKSKLQRQALGMSSVLKRETQKFQFDGAFAEFDSEGMFISMESNSRTVRLKLLKASEFDKYDQYANYKSDKAFRLANIWMDFGPKVETSVTYRGIEQALMMQVSDPKERNRVLRTDSGNIHERKSCRDL